MHAACVSPPLCALQEFCLRKHRTPLTKELLLLYLQVHNCLRSPGHDFADTTQIAVGTGRSAGVTSTHINRTKRWGDSPPTSTLRPVSICSATVFAKRILVPDKGCEYQAISSRHEQKSRVDLSKKQDHIRRSLLNSLLASQGID